MQGVSSPKRKVKSAVNQQIKAGLSAVKEFLAGRSNDEKVTPPEDKATREVVAAELLAAMAAGGTTDSPTEKPEKSVTDTQEIPRFDADGGVVPNSSESSNSQQSTAANTSPVESPTEQEQERARQLFVEHGYFDETVQNLRTASSPAERAVAARALGLVGSQRATAHLIAAMFDDDLEVRSAAETALNQISDASSEASPAGEAVGENKKSNQETTSTAKGKDNLVARPVEAVDGGVESSSSLPQAVEVSKAPAASAPAAKTPHLTVVPPNVPPDLTAATSASTDEENQLVLEEQTIREAMAEIERQTLAAITQLKESEDEVRWRIEREAKLRSEATVRQAEEEESRKRAEEEAAARREQAREAVAVEQAARLTAEAEAQLFADEETNLRLKAASLRLEVAEVVRRRSEKELARQQAAEAASHAEAMRARNEAKSRHETELARLDGEKEKLQTATDQVLQQQTKVRSARDKAAKEIEQLKQEQASVETAQRAESERLRREAEKKNNDAGEQLRVELEGLREAGEEVAKRRAEVESAREQADAEAQRLVEAQARMQAAEAARAQAEIERAQLEAEINQQVDKQQRLLEETRLRGEQEQQRLHEELRLRTEKEQQRLAELEVMKTKAEVESKDRAEKEQQIRSQIDSLRIADAETRRRIEDAEVRRRAADDAFRLIAEKVQRVETEAHAREKEEERMRAKLESERRNAAIEAQSRAEQEKRIREEIEMFRRLEEEERPRVEAATLQLAEAEARLQERKDRLKEDAEARVLAEAELMVVSEQRTPAAEPAAANVWQEQAAFASQDEAIAPDARSEVDGSEAAAANETTNAVDDAPDDAAREEVEASVVTPAIATYLNSVDPYKRAAAVAELARSGSEDAFSRIAECFDDHSPHVRNAAARALRRLEPDKAVDLFNRALEGASEDRRRNIGGAIATSGLATEAINNLASESREDTYNALSILFVMAKTGEVEPLVRALEEHRDDEIGKAVSKLLTLSGHRAAEPAGGS